MNIVSSDLKNTLVADMDHEFIINITHPTENVIAILEFDAKYLRRISRKYAIFGTHVCSKNNVAVAITEPDALLVSLEIPTASCTTLIEYNILRVTAIRNLATSIDGLPPGNNITLRRLSNAHYSLTSEVRLHSRTYILSCIRMASEEDHI